MWLFPSKNLDMDHNMSLLMEDINVIPSNNLELVLFANWIEKGKFKTASHLITCAALLIWSLCITSWFVGFATTWFVRSAGCFPFLLILNVIPMKPTSLFFPVMQKSFQNLLWKREGDRSMWEYPFAVAGVNITFMLIQMLDLQSG